MTDGPVAIVTGGTRGIGRAICVRLLADGWSVLATYRNDDTAAEAFAADHERLAVLRAGASDAAECARVVATATDRFGHIDHLVCSAGVNRDAPAATLTDEQWDDVVETNLSGAFRICRAALPAITASGRGRIVFVSSVAASMGNVGQAAYAASKAGLIGLARTLAREVAARGTTVNIVVPGPTADTDMTAGADAAFVAAISRKIPLHRLGRPEETAHAVRFLLDDMAAFTTGSTVTVDGGLSM